MRKQTTITGGEILENMPEHNLDYAARTIIAATKNLFEDPKIQAEYKAWKKARQKKTAQA